MKSHNGYIDTMKVMGFITLLPVVLEIMHPGNGWIVLACLMEFIVGFYQLQAGLVLFLSNEVRPQWADDHIRYYWWITAIYFVVLYLVYQQQPLDSWQFNVWLFGIPWAIAIYQFIIVYRLRDALILQEEERCEEGDVWERLEGRLTNAKKI